MNTLAVNYVRPFMMISYAILMLIIESVLFFTPLIALVPYIVFLLSSFATFFVQLFSKLYFPFSLISIPFHLFPSLMLLFATFFGFLSSTYFGILTMLFFAYFPMIVLAVIYVLIMGSNVTINDNKGGRQNVGAIWPNWPVAGGNSEYRFWVRIMNLLDYIAGGNWWLDLFKNNLFQGFINWGVFDGMGWNGAARGYYEAMEWVRNRLWNLRNSLRQAGTNFGKKFLKRLLNLARKVLDERGLVAQWHGGPNVGHANAITSWQDMLDTLGDIDALPAPPAPPVLQGRRALRSTHDLNHIVTDVIILFLCIIFFFIMRSYILHILFVILVAVCAKYI